MGMMVTAGAGKGIYNIVLGKDMPFEVDSLKTHPLNDFLVDTRWEKEKFAHEQEFSLAEKVFLIGYLGSDYIYNAANLHPGEWTPKEIEEQMEDDYYWDRYSLRAVARIYEVEYGYPPKTFRSIMDYEDNRIFYLRDMAPFSDERLVQKFSGMSQKDWEDELNEFMKKLTGEDRHYDVKICEEWWKE